MRRALLFQRLLASVFLLAGGMVTYMGFASSNGLVSVLGVLLLGIALMHRLFIAFDQIDDYIRITQGDQ